jgi:outer membrane cobalamin receptor
VNDTDPYNISFGNPGLKPEKSHNFNLNYSLFSPKYTLNASANYSYVNNSIERFSFIDEAVGDNVKQSTYDNIGRNQRVGVYVNAGWTPNKVLRINFNGGINYTDLKSAELDAANSGLNGNFYATAQVSLPKDFRINANGGYYSGWVQLQGKQSSQYWTSISVNKDFLQKKLTVSLSCANPFDKNREFEYSTTTDYFYVKGLSRYPAREGRISLSYRFGNMKESIRKVQRGISNDDVKGGGSGGNEGGGGGGGGM